MTATLPAITAPAPQLVHATIVYNPFDPSDRNTIVIDHDPGKALADYLGDLPADVDWSVGVNGALVDPEQWSATTLSPDDFITVAVRPHGGQGGGGKTVLRLVAMIAVMVVAWYAAPALAGAIPGLSAAGVSAATGIIGATIAPIGSFRVNQETAP